LKEQVELGSNGQFCSIRVVGCVSVSVSARRTSVMLAIIVAVDLTSDRHFTSRGCRPELPFSIAGPQSGLRTSPSIRTAPISSRRVLREYIYGCFDLIDNHLRRPSSCRISDHPVTSVVTRTPLSAILSCDLPYS
jgi:hypothetical protein